MHPITTALAALLSLWSPPAATPLPPAMCEPPRHVALISIDGFRPPFYLDASFPTPNLQRMAAEGVWASGLQTVFPSLTYPSHTTMVTGVIPSEHGIIYNRPEALAGPAEQQYFWADSMRVPALWDRVRAAGGTSAGLWWPAAIGADMSPNLPVPPHEAPGGSRLDLLRTVVAPAGFMEDMEARVTGSLTDQSFSNGSLQKERHLWEIGRHVVVTGKPTLLLYHVLATDAFQHSRGPASPEIHPAVAVADSAVGVLMEAYREAGILEQTTFVITGDHGFAGYTHGVAPNSWLAEAGYLTPDAAGLPRARFIAGGGFAFLLLRDPGDQEVISFVQGRIAALSPDEASRFEIVRAEKVREWGADPRAVLTLSARPGNRFEDRHEGPLVAPTPRPGGVHGHRPDLPELQTGFVVWGAGIQQTGRVGPAHALNITPLIASLLGLPGESSWSVPAWLTTHFCTS